MQPVSHVVHEPGSMTALVDIRRLAANSKLDPKTKSAQGQHLTPRPVAQFMASLFKTPEMDEVRLLIVLPDGQRHYRGFDYHVDNTRMQTEHIPADPDLLGLAQRVATATALPVWPGLGRRLDAAR